LRRQHIENLGLRAFVLDQRGEKSQSLFHEAIDLARAHGLTRLFADAHPHLNAWAQQVQEAASTEVSASGAAAASPRATAPPRETPMLRATPGSVLTPKEREVIVLARNLEQGDWSGAGSRHRDDQMARQESLSQAGRGPAQAGRAARAPAWPA
jgi:LuxR family transcriptional regulator, maltose regulon positive regulatory protein